MMETSSPPKGQRFNFWALGFGLATLITATLASVFHGLPVVKGVPVLQWVAIAFGLATLLLARTAQAYRESRWLRVAALGLGGAGLLFVVFGRTVI
jgi:hypothetical protein